MGAVKEVSSASSSPSVMVSVELCDQEYSKVSSVSTSDAVPSRFTVAPSAASWSSPALTVGAVLAESVMVTVTLSETVAGAV